MRRSDPDGGEGRHDIERTPDYPGGGPEAQSSDSAPIFYYSRMKRISNAPESVRRAYEEGYTPTRGFLKGLTGNAGLRSVFFTIILLSVAVVFLTVFGQQPDSADIGGISVAIKAFLYDDTVYVTVKCDASDDIHDPVAVLVDLSGLDSAGNSVVTSEMAGIYSGKALILRTAIKDFELTSVGAKVSIGDDESTLTAHVDRN